MLAMHWQTVSPLYTKRKFALFALPVDVGRSDPISVLHRLGAVSTECGRMHDDEDKHSATHIASNNRIRQAGSFTLVSPHQSKPHPTLSINNSYYIATTDAVRACVRACERVCVRACVRE